MIIDLSDPIVIGVFISIISATIFGIIHYVKTLVQLNFTDKKLSNVLSEMDSLNAKYKEEITGIKKKHGDELKRAIEYVADTYSKKMDELLKHHKPPSLDASNYAIPPKRRLP